MVIGASDITIGEVAARCNVTLRTLRFYEDIGLLTPTRRGTARFYSPSDITRLQVILKGKRLGFSLEEIRALINSNPESDAPSTIVERLPADKVVEQIGQLEQEREVLVLSIRELKDALAKRSA